MPTELIRTLECAGLDGLPALATVAEDGWLLRRSQRYSRRGNCVMPTATDSAIGMGCARAVISANWGGLFDLAVHPGHRRRGVYQPLANAHLAWAYERGARSAYLQVMENNQAARRRQMHLGFAEAYRYWYRIQLASSC